MVCTIIIPSTIVLLKKSATNLITFDLTFIRLQYGTYSRVLVQKDLLYSTNNASIIRRSYDTVEKNVFRSLELTLILQPYGTVLYGTGTVRVSKIRTVLMI